MDMIFQIMEASEKIVKLVKYFKFVGPSSKAVLKSTTLSRLFG